MSRRRLRSQLDRIASGRPLRRMRMSQDEDVVVRTAIALKVATSSDELDPNFVADLARRLHDKQAPVATRAGLRPTRRGLLAGGLATAISGVAGVVAGATTLGRRTPSHSGTLEPTDSAWLAVAPAAQLVAQKAVLFDLHGVQGVLSTDGDGTPRAVSGVCTHQGCVLVLALQHPQARLECPCHRAAFTLTGKVLFHKLPQEPAALPQLKTRVVGGTTEVLLPTSQPGPTR